MSSTKFTISRERHNILTIASTPTKNPNGVPYNEYELKRIRNLRKNEFQLQSLGISNLHLAEVVDEESEVQYDESEPEKNSSDDDDDSDYEPEKNDDINLVRVCNVSIYLFYLSLSHGNQSIS